MAKKKYRKVVVLITNIDKEKAETHGLYNGMTVDGGIASLESKTVLVKSLKEKELVRLTRDEAIFPSNKGLDNDAC